MNQINKLIILLFLFSCSNEAKIINNVELNDKEKIIFDSLSIAYIEGKESTDIEKFHYKLSIDSVLENKYYLLQDCYDDRNYSDNCKREALLLIKMDSTNDVAYMYLGRYYKHKNNIDSAIYFTKKAANNLIEMTSFPYIYLGILYDLNGDLDHADGSFKIAVDNSQTLESLIDNLEYSFIYSLKRKDYALAEFYFNNLDSVYFKNIKIYVGSYSKFKNNLYRNIIFLHKGVDLEQFKNSQDLRLLKYVNLYFYSVVSFDYIKYLDERKLINEDNSFLTYLDEIVSKESFPCDYYTKLEEEPNEFIQFSMFKMVECI